LVIVASSLGPLEEALQQLLAEGPPEVVLALFLHQLQQLEALLEVVCLCARVRQDAPLVQSLGHRHCAVRAHAEKPTPSATTMRGNKAKKEKKMKKKVSSQYKSISFALL